MVSAPPSHQGSGHQGIVVLPVTLFLVSWVRCWLRFLETLPTVTRFTPGERACGGHLLPRPGGRISQKATARTVSSCANILSSFKVWPLMFMLPAPPCCAEPTHFSVCQWILASAIIPGVSQQRLPAPAPPYLYTRPLEFAAIRSCLPFSLTRTEINTGSWVFISSLGL